MQTRYPSTTSHIVQVPVAEYYASEIQSLTTPTSTVLLTNWALCLIHTKATSICVCSLQNGWMSLPESWTEYWIGIPTRLPPKSTIIVQKLQADTSAAPGRSRRPVGGLPNFALPAESPTLAAFSRRAFSGGVPMGVGEARSSSPTSRLADRQPVSPTASGSVRRRLMHAPKSNTASAPPSTAQAGGFRASTAVTTHRRHPLN